MVQALTGAGPRNVWLAPSRCYTPDIFVQSCTSTSLTTTASFFLCTSIPAMRYIRSSWREQRVCRNLRQPRSRAIAAPHQRSATPIYSLHHARSGSDTLTASAYPVSERPYHSHRPLFCPILVVIFMLAAALEQLDADHHGKALTSTNSSTRYLSFLEHAFNPAKGRFKNFLGYDRRWNEPVGSEDCHGRALWALGTVLGISEDRGLRGAAGRLFELSLPAVVEFSSPRAWAYSLLGIQEYLSSFPGDRDAQRVRSGLSRRLLEMYESIQRPDWKWFENVLAYGNARLPQSLLVAGAACSDDRMICAGLESLDWLSNIQHCETNGHFVPIGSEGFYRKDAEKARFDQQPLEAAGAVSACLQAFRVTGDSCWRSEAWSAFNWFLGDNDLQLPLYDSATGGCRDGLHPDRANENQGAESTLSFLMALLEMRSLQEPALKEIHP